MKRSLFTFLLCLQSSLSFANNKVIDFCVFDENRLNFSNLQLAFAKELLAHDINLNVSTISSFPRIAKDLSNRPNVCTSVRIPTDELKGNVDFLQPAFNFDIDLYKAKNKPDDAGDQLIAVLQSTTADKVVIRHKLKPFYMATHNQAINVINKRDINYWLSVSTIYQDFQLMAKKGSNIRKFTKVKTLKSETVWLSCNKGVSQNAIKKIAPIMKEFISSGRLRQLFIDAGCEALSVH